MEKGFDLEMSFVQVLSEFLAYKFPWWGVYHLNFDPDSRTVYFNCLNPDKRQIIIKDAMKLAYLDIGIEKFIIIQPGYSNITIPHVSRRTS
jgi:hypothetical protein